MTLTTAPPNYTEGVCISVRVLFNKLIDNKTVQSRTAVHFKCHKMTLLEIGAIKLPLYGLQS